LTQTQAAEEKSKVRRDAYRRVAESRASHFARADSSDRLRIRPVGSTTPLPGARKPGAGTLRSLHARVIPWRGLTWVFGGALAEEEKEHWPGPFATARQIMQNRDAVAAARQERMQDGELEELRTVKIDWKPRRDPRPESPAEVGIPKVRLIRI
jgi:hypothetical protein